MQATIHHINIMYQIKEATKPYHDKIEQNTLTKSVADGTITKEDYIRLLCKFYGFYQQSELMLAQSKLWSTYQFDIAQREKTPLLLQDLSFFGYDVSQIALCQDMPHLDTDSQKLGYLYVVEGSTLGGQYLSRVLEKQFGFVTNQGASYFNSYGTANIGSMWKNFMEVLVKATQDHLVSEQEVINTSILTFQKLDTWLG